MKVIGDLKHATKFCVNTLDKGILWVPSYEIAKQYVNNPNNKDWYGQDIIASYEQVVKADDGKNYFKSQAPKKDPIREFKDNLITFREQSYKKLKKELENYAKAKGFDSFLELISFSNCTVDKYRKLAEDAIDYRNKIYEYTENFFLELDIDHIEEVIDISYVYDDYLKNFPFM